MKTFLLATAAVLASTSAYAADYDVAHPFYTPAEGKFVSTTDFEFEHTFDKVKNADRKSSDDEKTFTETLKYGITDDIQVGLEISRDWEKEKWKSDTWGIAGVNRDYTNSWSVNAGYNVINDGKAFLNVGLEFRETYLREPTGIGTSVKTHGRDFFINAIGGYNFDDVTVFGEITYDRMYYSSVNNINKIRFYTLEAGAYKAINEQISARTSLLAEYDQTKNAEERTYWWTVGADYLISKKMGVGVRAAYMLDNDVNGHPIGNEDAHSGYKLGIDFTVEF